MQFDEIIGCQIVRIEYLGWYENCGLLNDTLLEGATESTKKVV